MSGVATAAVGLGLGLVGGVGKLISSGSANSKLNALLAQDPTYKANPIAAQRMALAQSLLNARAPGADQSAGYIQGRQANNQASVTRNATDGRRALPAGAEGQAHTNKSFHDLQ